MGHNSIFIIAKAVVAFGVVVYFISIIAIVGDDKTNGDAKEGKRNPWYYIVAAFVCLLIGCLLPE